MKKFEWFARALVILFLLTHFLSLLGSGLIARLYGPEFVDAQSVTLHLVVSARSLLSTAVQLAVGIWLFVQARKSEDTPWIWLLFGLVYGLIAAVLFFLLRVNDSKIPNRIGVQTVDKTVE